MKKPFIINALLILTGYSTFSYSAPNMQFYGTLIEPPVCVIENGENIYVSFGDRVRTRKVDGINYLQTFDFAIDCADTKGNPWELTLSIEGTPTAFDPAALQTNMSDLGIRILQNSQPFTLNQRLPITPQVRFTLQAVPVQKPGATLLEGPFYASATLRADYQ